MPVWTVLIPALGGGVVVMLKRAAPVTTWSFHLVTAAVGILLYALVSRVPRDLLGRRALAVLSALTIAATIGSLASWPKDFLPDQTFAGQQFYVSGLVCPVALVLAAVAIRHNVHAALAGLLALQPIHWVRPDAGQASALGIGATALALLSVRAGARRWVLPHILAVCVAWLRFNPTTPTPFVEDIVLHAFMLGSVSAFGALSGLILAVCSPFALARATSRVFAAQAALFLYFASTVLVSIFGDFPVPWLGCSSSPVVGSFLGLGLLNAWSKPNWRARGPPLGARVKHTITL